MPAVPCPPPLDHSRPDGRAARWLLATRPAFLTLTLGGVLLGFAGSGGDALGQRWPQAALALLLALLCHAAVNVINDVADHDNGSDAANVARQFPFTGGSRVIQNALLSRRDMARLAQGLFALVIGGGLLLVVLASLSLLPTCCRYGPRCCCRCGRCRHGRPSRCGTMPRNRRDCVPP